MVLSDIILSEVRLPPTENSLYKKPTKKMHQIILKTSVGNINHHIELKRDHVIQYGINQSTECTDRLANLK